jgi:hypothetical protein
MTPGKTNPGKRENKPGFFSIPPQGGIELNDRKSGVRHYIQHSLAPLESKYFFEKYSKQS